jgi:hypothetical protein
METNGRHRIPLLAHYLLLGAIAILAGIVQQFPSWREVTGVDPGLLPFVVMIVAGFLTASVASFLEGAVSGMLVGFLGAAAGTLFARLSGAPGAGGFRTVFAYLAIMTCLGPLFAAVGGAGGTLLRHLVEHRRRHDLNPHSPD